MDVFLAFLLIKIFIEGEQMKHLLPACFTLLMLLLSLTATITHASDVQEQVQTTRKTQITDSDTNRQSSVSADNKDEKMYMEIGEMTVTGKSSDLSGADAPASVDVIGADQIEMQNVDFSMELLKKVPGFYFGDCGIRGSSQARCLFADLTPTTMHPSR